MLDMFLVWLSNNLGCRDCAEVHVKPILTLTLPGRPIVKKNTQRLVGSGRFKRRILSPQYRAWAERAVLACASHVKIEMVTRPVTAHYQFYFANRQAEADVSNLCEAPGDLMKDAGVLKDDRLIMSIVAEKFFGHEPRTEIQLFEYELPTTNEGERE